MGDKQEKGHSQNQTQAAASGLDLVVYAFSPMSQKAPSLFNVQTEINRAENTL